MSGLSALYTHTIFRCNYLFIMETAPYIFWPSNFFISSLKSQLSLEELNCKQWCTASHHRTTQLSSLRHKHLNISKTHMKCLICPRNLTSTINVTFSFPSLQAKPTWQQEKGLSSPHLQVSNINWKPTQLLSLKTSLPDSLNIKETEKALGSQKAFEERETHSTFKQTSLKSILHIQSLKEM